MGSNVSTTSNNNNVRNEEKPINNNRPPPARVDQVVAAANNNRDYETSNDDNQDNVIQIIRPVSFLNHSANINRVISFRSSTEWKEYYQLNIHSLRAKNPYKLIVVFFTATWSGFCRYIEPILDDLATKYTDVEFHKIDVDKLFEISKEYSVTTMPTFLFMKRGKVVDKVLGPMHQEIRTKIEKYRV